MQFQQILKLRLFDIGIKYFQLIYQSIYYATRLEFDCMILANFRVIFWHRRTIASVFYLDLAVEH